MKKTAKSYKTKRAQFYMAAAGAVVPPDAGDATDGKTALTQSRRLFRARKKKAKTIPAMSRKAPSVGTFGVTSLEELAQLMSMYKTSSELLEACGLRTRQSLHQSVADTSELLTRATTDGQPVSRHIQNIIAAINGHDEPLAALMRFFLFLMPQEHRAVAAKLMSAYIQIPLDSLVSIKEN